MREKRPTVLLPLVLMFIQECDGDIDQATEAFMCFLDENNLWGKKVSPEMIMQILKKDAEEYDKNERDKDI